MTRLVSFSALCLATATLAGCSSDAFNKDTPRSAYFVTPPVCDPTDPKCTPCDASDPSCKPEDPSVPPCDPSDAACKASSDASCDPQDVKFDEACATHYGYAWNGKFCDEVHGCACFGEDCDSLFKTQDDCESHYAECTGAVEDDCASTAKDLALLLAEARSCNVASAAAVVCDGTVVPTTSGCPVPVASGTSEATLKYLEMFSEYAQHCALPVPACPDPKGVPIDCTQAPDIDGLLGECSFADEKNTKSDAAE